MIHRMLKPIFLLVIVVSLLSSGGAISAAPTSASPDSANTLRRACITSEHRISFRRGAISGAARGFLSPLCPQAFFVLRAFAGQRMFATLSSTGPARGEITFPGGGGAGQPTGTYGIFFDDTLPATGDYHFRISESTMAQAWFGSFTLRVTII